MTDKKPKMNYEIIKTKDDFYDGQVRRETIVEFPDGSRKKYAAILPDTSTEEEIQTAMDKILSAYLDG